MTLTTLIVIYSFISLEWNTTSTKVSIILNSHYIIFDTLTTVPLL